MHNTLTAVSIVRLLLYPVILATFIFHPLACGIAAIFFMTKKKYNKSWNSVRCKLPVLLICANESGDSS